MPVSKTLRFEVLRRDGFKCRYCGLTAEQNELQVDHVKPVTLGGTDAPENLVTACADCNAGKGKIPPGAPLVADVAADALRWAAAMEEAGRRINASEARVNKFLDGFNTAWLDWHYGGDNRNKIPRPNDWRETIKKLRAAGLDQDALEDALRIAMNSKARPEGTWRYFCGVCWRKVTERQAVAEALLTESEPAE